MTKQEKIIEAWGANYEEFKDFIDSDGWGIYPHFQKHEMTEDVRPIEFKENGLGFRPKSLKGIEDNNGWIKIESEEDLPKFKSKNNELLCFIKSSNYEEIGMGKFSFGTFKTFFGNYYENVTHYQPIEKPQPPIY